MSYLSKRSDLLSMDVTVNSVSFEGEEAKAEVHFQAKGSTAPNAGMTMNYVLERKDGQWDVKGKTGSNASHGANASGVNAPAGVSQTPGPMDGMPRVPAPGASGQLPPGHPAVGSGSSSQPK